MAAYLFCRIRVLDMVGRHHPTLEVLDGLGWQTWFSAAAPPPDALFGGIRAILVAGLKSGGSVRQCAARWA